MRNFCKKDCKKNKKIVSFFLTISMENVNIILARCKPSKCGSAGIGRQARLRILCQQWRVGSSPIFRSKGSLLAEASFFITMIEC